jgi:ABC-type transport system substrate-binding protein
MIAGQTTVDEVKRKAIYMKANALVHAAVPAIPIVHTVVPIALTSGIAGFVPSPDYSYHFNLIKPAEAAK